MSLDTLLKRLPSHFKKTPDSNNYKLFTLIAKSIDDSTELYATIQKFWDVDQAEGVGLDRLGKDEGISRGSYDDDTYRKLIKIQFIVNMSEGDIEVMNTILHAYMGDDFLHIEEGWSSLLEEPAALIINFALSTQTIPYRLIKRIKPTAVAIYIALNQISEIRFETKYQAIKFPFRLCGTFNCGTSPYPEYSPRKLELFLQLETKSGKHESVVPLTGLFNAGQGGKRP